MHLSNQNKATLFKLLHRASEHDLPPDKLMMTLVKQGPDDLKPLCAKTEVLIKKKTNIGLAGSKTGLWGIRERKAITKAFETQNHKETFEKLANHYQVRVNKKSSLQHLLPFFIFLIVAAIAAPLPQFLYGDMGIIALILLTLLPILSILITIWFLSLPISILDKKWAIEFGLPKFILGVPKLGPKHINKEMGTFLEWTGIYKISGYEWINAVSEAGKEVANPVIRYNLETISARIKRHDTPSDAIGACEYFPENAIADLTEAGKNDDVPAYLIKYNTKRTIKDNTDLQHLTKTPRLLITCIALGLFAYAAFDYALLSGLL